MFGEGTVVSLSKVRGTMHQYYEQYQQGYYQEVYDMLLVKQDEMHSPLFFEEASQVMRLMMQRVRVNIEMILQRLPELGYVFHKGYARPFASEHEKEVYEQETPIFRPPRKDVQEQVAVLEQRSGSLPLSLRFFYEEVGCVNLVGAFSSMKVEDAVLLDPLFIFSLDIVSIQVTMQEENWKEDPRFILSGDCDFKYGFGGGGTYDMILSSKTVDTLLEGEPHNTTFVKYLRSCLLQWGGFPGLETSPFLSQEQLAYLTHDLLPF